MTILMLNAKDGKTGLHGGKMLLTMKLADIDLKPKGVAHILSLQDEFDVNVNYCNEVGIYICGHAHARIERAGGGSHGKPCRMSLRVESSDAEDFIHLTFKMYEKLGIVYSDLPRPKYRLDDLSLVRGLRNDLRSLRRYIASKLRFSRKAVN
jgi:hypothetical protein